MILDDEDDEEMMRAPGVVAWLREIEARGEARAEEKTITELLGRLFARRVGRRPTAGEERSIVERSRAIGPGEVEDALLDLDSDALVRWLSEPVQRS